MNHQGSRRPVMTTSPRTESFALKENPLTSYLITFRPEKIRLILPVLDVRTYDSL